MLLSALLLSLSCGIPDTAYIYPVVEFTTARGAGSSAFTFFNRTENGDTIFEGYLFFYRFFTREDLDGKPNPITYLESLAGSDFTTSSKISLMLKEPYGGGNTGFYRPLYLKNSDDVSSHAKLVIPEDIRSASFSVKVDFSDTEINYGSAYLLYDGNENNYIVYRKDTYDPDASEAFLEDLSFIPDDFIENQSDLPTKVYTSAYNEIYMALFVVPFGIDSDLSFSYADACSLGYIRLYFRY